MRVFDTPGHTRGHITFWFPAAAALFPGRRFKGMSAVLLNSMLQGKLRSFLASSGQGHRQACAVLRRSWTNIGR
jgi:hypothetical protein